MPLFVVAEAPPGAPIELPEEPLCCPDPVCEPDVLDDPEELLCAPAANEAESKTANVSFSANASFRMIYPSLS